QSSNNKFFINNKHRLLLVFYVIHNQPQTNRLVNMNNLHQHVLVFRIVLYILTYFFFSYIKYNDSKAKKALTNHNPEIENKIAVNPEKVIFKIFKSFFHTLPPFLNLLLQ